MNATPTRKVRLAETRLSRLTHLLRLALLAACIIGTALAQAPMIQGVVNGASFQPLLSPGVQAAIFGQNLTTEGLCFADEIPLPPTLCGARVLVDGISSPISFASPNQMTVIFPFGLNPGPTEVVVEASGVRSEPIQVTLETHAPGILTAAGGGEGLGSFTNRGALVTEESPAEPGDILSLTAVGLGPTTPPVAAGDPAPNSPLAETVTTPTITIGEGPGPSAVTTPKQQALVAEVLFSGLSPGLTGAYTVNFQVPMGLSEGLLPLTLGIGGQVSNTVLLPVGLPVPVIQSLVSAASFGSGGLASPGSILTMFADNIMTEQGLSLFPATEF